LCLVIVCTIYFYQLKAFITCVDVVTIFCYQTAVIIYKRQSFIIRCLFHYCCNNLQRQSLIRCLFDFIWLWIFLSSVTTHSLCLFLPDITFFIHFFAMLTCCLLVRLSLELIEGLRSYLLTIKQTVIQGLSPVLVPPQAISGAMWVQCGVQCGDRPLTI